MMKPAPRKVITLTTNVVSSPPRTRRSKPLFTKSAASRERNSGTSGARASTNAGTSTPSSCTMAMVPRPSRRLMASPKTPISTKAVGFCKGPTMGRSQMPVTFNGMGLPNRRISSSVPIFASSFSAASLSSKTSLGPVGKTPSATRSVRTSYSVGISMPSAATTTRRLDWVSGSLAPSARSSVREPSILPTAISTPGQLRTVSRTLRSMRPPPG